MYEKTPFFLDLDSEEAKAENAYFKKKSNDETEKPSKMHAHLLKNRKATKLDVERQLVVLDNGQKVYYQKVNFFSFLFFLFLI